MNLHQALQLATNFLLTHRLIGIGLLVVAVIVVVKKPVAALKLTLLAALLVAGFYLFSQLGNATFHGLLEEQHGISQTTKQIGNETR